MKIGKVKIDKELFFNPEFRELVVARNFRNINTSVLKDEFGENLYILTCECDFFEDLLDDEEIPIYTFLVSYKHEIISVKRHNYDN